MGDISIIARRLPDKGIEYGWSGNGGYFKNVGISALTYQDDEDVERLFALGEISHLGIPGSEHFKSWIWSTVPANSPMNRNKSERWMFSQIAFIDYGYFREPDGDWYYVIPSPFRVKIPLFLVYNHLDDDLFEFVYLSAVQHEIGKFIFDKYPDADPDFLPYLSDLGINAEEVKKAILDSDYPLHELYELHRPVFNYFDDWIVVDCDENYQEITNIYMRPRAPEAERLETCDWYTPNKKNRPNMDNLVFTIDYTIVQNCLNNIQEDKLPSDDELASREMLIRHLVHSGKLDEIKKNAAEEGLVGEEAEGYVYSFMTGLIKSREDVLYRCLKEHLETEKIMKILNITENYVIKFASESRLKIKEHPCK